MRDSRAIQQRITDGGLACRTRVICGFTGRERLQSGRQPTMRDIVIGVDTGLSGERVAAARC